MRTRGKIRPSKPASALSLLMGIGFICFGIFFVLPHAGLFGIVWVLAAAGITVYHAVNLFSDSGIATEVVDFESPKQNHTSSGISSKTPIETRLSELANLKSKRLISEKEYQEKRSRILDDI